MTVGWIFQKCWPSECSSIIGWWPPSPQPPCQPCPPCPPWSFWMFCAHWPPIPLLLPWISAHPSPFPSPLIFWLLPEPPTISDRAVGANTEHKACNSNATLSPIWAKIFCQISLWDGPGRCKLIIVANNAHNNKIAWKILLYVSNCQKIQLQLGQVELMSIGNVLLLEDRRVFFSVVMISISVCTGDSRGEYTVGSWIFGEQKVRPIVIQSQGGWHQLSFRESLGERWSNLDSIGQICGVAGQYQSWHVNFTL